MSRMSELLQVTEEEKLGILRYYNISDAEFDENVQIIKDWLEKNAHLPKESLLMLNTSGMSIPPIEYENKIKLTLLNCKMSLEKTKQALEGYYRVRRLYSDFFERMMPNTEDYKKSKSYVQTIVMPKLTPDLCRITIFKHRDVMGEAEDALQYNLIPLMMAEIRFFNDCFLSNIIIIDMENYGIKTLMKYSPSINQKLVNILNSVNLRIQEVHLINTPSFLERFMIILRSVLPAKVMSRIHVHPTHATLTEFIPKEYLPSNYGGTQKSMAELYEEWCVELEKMEPLFQTLLDVRSSEDVKKSQDFEIFGMGSEGSFKKLAVD